MKLTQNFRILILSLSIASCQHPHNSTKSKQIGSKAKTTKPQKVSHSKDSLSGTKNLYVKNDSLFVIINAKTYYITNAASIGCKNSYPAIYEIKNDTIKKSATLISHNFIFFTTYIDLGTGYRGCLYVFDTRKKILIKDLDFKRNYLFSSSAIFVLDERKKKIFAIDSPDWFDKKKKTTWFISASMYSIEGSKFRFFKTLYEEHEDTEDSTIVKFYYKSLDNNGKQGKILPKNWWKYKKISVISIGNPPSNHNLTMKHTSAKFCCILSAC